MRDETAFETTAFLGAARRAKRDPYRLSLFGRHLEPDENPLAILSVHGGMLLVTDRRILELHAHLEIHGAWNVKQFLGYAVAREIRRAEVRGVDHLVGPPQEDRRHATQIEDRLVLRIRDGAEEILIARGPQAVLTEDDIRELRAAILGAQAK